MLGGIDRIILRVPAVAGAVKYYRDALGLKLLREENGLASFMMADGKTELVLRADPDQPAEEIYYRVENVRDLYARREELKLKFLQPPRQAARGYRAAVRDPFGNVLLLLDRSMENAGAGAVEDGAPPDALFPGVEPHIPARRTKLIDIYKEIGRTADDLPYTPQFEKLFDLYTADLPSPKPTSREVWRHLLNLRKGGKLPRLGEARSPAPQISQEDEEFLRELIGKNIGQRDRLPYTNDFSRLVDEFNSKQARPLSPHLVWRLVARIAK